MAHKNALKAYAPMARREFVKAVTERAALYGITADKTLPCEVKGDFAFIANRPFPKDVAKKRTALASMVQHLGYVQAMEEIAYTWFNRLVAIRFMEVNGYLSHGYRVLSHPEGLSEPEILGKAQFIEKLGGLDKSEIISLKTATGKEGELYRKLLVAQCNELSTAMPFLFERVDDLTELLLPDNLLNTDSIIRKMVAEIPEEDWKEVEIVGWLYQFYISERKEELMKAKKAYKTEEIPAVTQLFTPNWIVKYLVENSLGAKWLSTYPKSALREKMQYYIPPAEQSAEVNAKLKEITPESLNPEELTVMDPACGSGHILVEAYNVLKEIYLERGYRPRDIASLILTKNLHGLEIDERAAQLAGFALMMRAYADDRDIFNKQIRPDIICLKESNDLDIGDICRNIESAYTGKLSRFSKDKLAFMDEVDAPLFVKAKEKNEGVLEQAEAVQHVRTLLNLFHSAKTFGSLIRIPDELADSLEMLKEQLLAISKSPETGMLVKSAVDNSLVFIYQAIALSQKNDCVIANPPYLGGGKMNPELKAFVKKEYPDTKADLFTIFIERGFVMAKDSIGYTAMVTMHSWMFISSFEACRKSWIENKFIQSMAHLGARAFSTISGEVVTVTAFAAGNFSLPQYKPSFLRLVDGDEEEKRLGIISKKNLFCRNTQADFKKIPGAPIAYWVSDRVKTIYEESLPLNTIAESCVGLQTGDNGRFVRFWYEVSHDNLALNCSSTEEAKKTNKTWFPCNKGGTFRRWYGNQESVVNWGNDGEDIKNNIPSAVVRNEHTYFHQVSAWSKVTSGKFVLRYFPIGFIHNDASCFIHTGNSKALLFITGLLNSKVADKILAEFNPTLNYVPGQISQVPIIKDWEVVFEKVTSIVKDNIEISKLDWDTSELSLDFKGSAILQTSQNTLSAAYDEYCSRCAKMSNKMTQLEENSNRVFIEAYGLQAELSPEVPIGEITLFANPKYRYSEKVTNEDVRIRFKRDTVAEFLSYLVGCIMGRYSANLPGLIYASQGNVGFDTHKYVTSPADDDGILPLSELEWFDDDLASKLIGFIETVWVKKTLDENLDFIAEAIGRKSSESSRETIRRYFVNDFFKDHCQTYKNRPIYWLFSSGKEKAFQALVYLHRYNEGTLARMRTEYLLPLQTKITRHIEHLTKDKEAATGAAANKIQKEITSLQKQHAELVKYDETLRHYADKRIKLDLDDGIKANYVKFGELLEPIKGLKNGPEED